MLAYQIHRVFEDLEGAIERAAQAKMKAKVVHDHRLNAERTIEIYETIINGYSTEIPVNKTKRFLQTSLIYFGEYFNQMYLLFLLPLYTGYLPEADFGYFDTVVALLNMIAPLIALEIWSGILRFALDYKVEQSLENGRWYGMV